MRSIGTVALLALALAACDDQPLAGDAPDRTQVVIQDEGDRTTTPAPADGTRRTDQERMAGGEGCAVFVEGEGGERKCAEAFVATLEPTAGNEAEGTVRFERVAEGVRVTADVQKLPGGVHAYHVHTFGDCSAPDATSAGPHLTFAGAAHQDHGQPVTGADARDRTGTMGDRTGAMGEEMDAPGGVAGSGGAGTTGGVAGAPDAGEPDGTAPPPGTTSGGTMEPTGVAGSAGTASPPQIIAGNLGELEVQEGGTATATVVVPEADIEELIGRAVVIHAQGNDLSQPPDGGAGDRIACGVIGVAQPG